MEYKVCILAAGKNERVSYAKDINMALLPVGDKSVISHIIDKFSKDIEIVIPVGYKSSQLQDFMAIAHLHRKITFVDVDNFNKPGSGPGYSLLCCKKHLQCSFIQFAGDTLVSEDIPAPDKNWFGVSEVDNTDRFSSVKIENGKIIRLDDKIKSDNKYAFIGLAGVKDYEHFWNSLENNRDMIKGEVQVSNGFKSLIEKELFPEKFSWFDTGTMESYKHALENYPNGTPYRG